MYKVLYDKSHEDTPTPTFDNTLLRDVTMEDLRALQDLMDLWDEGNFDEFADVWDITPLFSSKT